MDRQIRNFSIIAHIDHGKSTLADRMLEHTKTVEHRKMKEQILDSMDLERERGITIKMQPVRMSYLHLGKAFQLNLIDTPGHIDFSYEVSRALKAVEGVLLLVDSTQGIQAQTLTTLAAAETQKCVIIPVISKIDSPIARVNEVKAEIAQRLQVSEGAVFAVSGKTGEGVDELLRAIVERIPAPSPASTENREGINADDPRGLIFDFSYSTHRGVSVYLRVFDGAFKKGEPLTFSVAGKDFTALEVGTFSPEETPADVLSAGGIGDIVTGIKEPGIVAVGDTILAAKGTLPALPGYEKPRPVVWASVYPESQDDLPLLRQSLERLRLSDSSLSYEEESSGVMGRGFRCGFLGMLHLEIIVERLRREFSLQLVVTQPTTVYEITKQNGSVEEIYAPARFPDDGTALRVREMWVNVHVIAPPVYIGSVSQLIYEHEAEVGDSEALPDGKVQLSAAMPLRELMRGFFDRLKSVSSGLASLSYELTTMREADVVRLDILVAEEMVPAFSRIISRRRLQYDAESMVEKLEDLLPKQLFELKIQAKTGGRIIASRRKSAMRKDVTGYLYGGDVTRKMKLLEKQKRGKKKMLARGKVDIPHEVFLKVVRESGA